MKHLYQRKEDCKEYYNIVRLAAFIDTDGHININRTSAASGRYHYRIHLAITNTNTLIIDWAVANFGGTYPKPTPTGEGHKDVYHWNLSGKRAYRVLLLIKDDLLLKREQAEICIKHFEKVSKWKFTNNRPLWAEKLSEELYQRCRLLNKKGEFIEDVKVKSYSRIVKRKVITLEEFA